MRANSVRHAKHAIYDYLLKHYDMADVRRSLVPTKIKGLEEVEDSVALRRYDTARRQIAREFRDKRERLRKYLPKDHPEGMQ